MRGAEWAGPCPHDDRQLLQFLRRRDSAGGAAARLPAQRAAGVGRAGLEMGVGPVGEIGGDGVLVEGFQTALLVPAGRRCGDWLWTGGAGGMRGGTSYFRAAMNL